MKILCAFLAFLVFAAGRATAGEITYRFSMSEDEFRIINKDGYELIRLENAVALGPPGSPHIPSLRLLFVLPQGARVTGVRIASPRWRSMPGAYFLYPVQPPRPLSERGVGFMKPDQDVYSSVEATPGKAVAHVSSGNAGGFRVAGFTITPFRYWPGQQRLTFLSSGTLVVEYAVTGYIGIPRSSSAIDELSEALKAIVENADEVDLFAPPCSMRPKTYQGLDAVAYRHIIITSEALAPFLEPLREWRTKQGFPSQVVTVSEIVAQYPGWDDAERVRNYIRDANETWGTLYFTLAGDLGVVPVRNVSQADTFSGMYMPVDLYFSDLDGTWDDNGNHIYGEPDFDTLDMYADVFVGRASIETETEATTFVSKVFAYEQAPPAGYIENCLLPAVQLWTNYHGDIVNDSIADGTPPPWIDIKLYESLGNVSRAAVKSAINDGVGFCHYAAHGNENGVYHADSDTVLHSTDAAMLANGEMLGIHNSIACISGAFDAGDVGGDCFAEHLMNNPNGGAVGVIMNSRVGLGTPPDMGPSEMLSLEFYRKVFREDLFRIGMAHAVSKDVYVPLGDSLWYYAFCIAELNLFGDPALAMWTKEPQSQVVDHPEHLPIGPGDFTVTVAHGAGEPLEDALVCIMSTSGDIYDYGLTDGSGEITFHVEPPDEDTIQVTSTAHNYLPYEGEIYATQMADAPESGGRDTRPYFAITANPLQGSTIFRFRLNERAAVDIRVYDVSGRIISHPVCRAYEPGLHYCRWQGRISSGRPVASGVYFVIFRADNVTISKKLVVLR